MRGGTVGNTKKRIQNTFSGQTIYKQMSLALRKQFGLIGARDATITDE